MTSLGAAQDVPLIIGGGLAGMMAALNLAPQNVRMLIAAPQADGAASAWAQGGLAAAVGPDDSVAFHLADTLAAGDGHVDEDAARRIVGAGPALVEELRRLGARFDNGLGLEAGHGRRRIVHAMGDGSGREILRAVTEAVLRAGHATIIEGSAVRLILRDGAVAGVLARTPAGPAVIAASRVVIATGGAGALFAQTTNPPGAAGSGLTLALEAGAALADMEFVQFHPTALDCGLDPMPLVSEAVRGEGAVLIDGQGTRFMAGEGRAELEPRDVVSRAVWRHMQKGHRVFLDARACLGARFAARFPAIDAACHAAGIDPARTPIPVRPAAHYVMGGIAVDARGRSTVPGLWACGEAACTGLHGANRLASNSLLEAAVTGQDVARDIAGTTARPLAPLPVPRALPAPETSRVRQIVSRGAGVLRNEEGLGAARAALQALAFGAGPDAAPARLALLMVTAMERRRESRGGHCRTDFPSKIAGPARRAALTWNDVLADGNARFERLPAVPVTA